MGFMAGTQGSIGTCNSIMHDYHLTLIFLSSVSNERPIFIRERMNKTYDTSAYFWAKAFAELPVLIAQPTLLIGMSYYVIGLNNPAYKFFLLSNSLFEGIKCVNHLSQ